MHSPQDTGAFEYVADEVRRLNPLLDSATVRSAMGSLGLTGPKALRPIGALSGGEKARVALATFCLTPHNGGEGASVRVRCALFVSFARFFSACPFA